MSYRLWYWWHDTFLSHCIDTVHGETGYKRSRCCCGSKKWDIA